MSSAADPFTADPELERRADGRLWSAGWALGLGVGLAGLLIALGALPIPVAAGLAIAAAPGALGALLAPNRVVSNGLLAAWTVATALAALSSGGVAGPLAPLLLGPLAAAIAFGAPPRSGLIAALAGFALTLLVQVLGLAQPALAPPALYPVAAIALLAAVIGLGMAAASRGLLQRARLAVAADDQSFFLDLADSLPVATLALDRHGAVEARLGPSTPGLGAGLEQGLVAAAAEADRPGLQAAIAAALEHGAAEAAFSPVGAPERRVAVSLRRRHSDGLTAMLRELAEAPPVILTAEPPPVVEREYGLDHLERLTTGPQAQRIEELEAALVVAEAARADAEHSAQARSRFLANMSHELRTPLNAILGFSDIMKTRLFGPIPDRYGEYAELIHDSGRHLTDLINDVLDMSKIEADRYELRIERFDVREAVTSALRLVRLQADEAGVHLRGLGPREPLMVEADRRAMKQMVLNLVTNALKFTPKGGEVRVTTEAGPERMLEITVSDTGVGIAPEDLERLGRPFEQAGDAQSRARGTGLGLSLVKALAGLHGGELTLESALGEGTAAILRLPVIEPPAFEADERVDAPGAEREAEAASESEPGAEAIEAEAEVPPPPMPEEPRPPPPPRAGEVIQFRPPPSNQG